VHKLSDTGYSVISIDLASKPELPGKFIKYDLRDLKSESGRLYLLTEVRKACGAESISAVVNNAAIQILGSTEDLRLEDFSKTMDVNVFAPLALIQLFLADLKSNKGTVVNIGSIHSSLTKPGFVSYATSKSAIEGLGSALAVDLGKTGITINTIKPAAIQTEMLEESFVNSPNDLEQLAGFHPSGIIGQVGDVAELVTYLISTSSQFLNGSSIDLSGAIHHRLHDPN